MTTKVADSIVCESLRCVFSLYVMINAGSLEKLPLTSLLAECDLVVLSLRNTSVESDSSPESRLRFIAWRLHISTGAHIFFVGSIM